MTIDVADYVSKWLQRPFLAVLCLTAAMAVVSLSDCHPEHVPMAARIAAR